MSDVTIPKQVAWVLRHPDGALTAEFLEDAVISPVRKESGAWLHMITTTQAEAYADARVREALENLDEALDEAFSKLQTDDKSHDFWMGVGSALEAAERAIRALIPPTE